MGRILIDIVAQDLDEILPAYQIPRNVDDVRMFVGGSGGATSIAFSRLGNTVNFLGLIGDDSSGRIAVERLNHFGVLTQFLELQPEADTAIHVVAVDAFGNTGYVVTNGADLLLSRLEKKIEVLAKAVAKSEVLHIGNFERFVDSSAAAGEPLKSWLKYFRKYNRDLIVSVDASKELHLSHRIAPLADQINYYFANRYEATSAVSQSLNQKGPIHAHMAAGIVAEFGVRNAVIVKLGEDGALFKNTKTGQVGTVQGCHVAAKNLNGAGNLFSAVAVHELANGRRLPDAVKAANLAAGHHVSLRHGIIESESFNKIHTPLPLRTKKKKKDQVAFPESFDRSRSLSVDQQKAWARLMANPELGGLAPESKVLDLGCGTGRFASIMVEELGFSVTCLDNNREMLTRAKENIAWIEKIEWIQGDALYLSHELNERRGQFDAVWASSLLQNIEKQNWMTLFLEIHAMLHSHGKFILRTATRELISSIWFYECFSGHSNLLNRLPDLPTLMRFLRKTGFKPKCSVRVEDVASVPKDELVRRFAAKPYNWCRATGDDIFEREIEELKSRIEYLGGSTGLVQWHQPAWFIVAERTS